MSRRVAIVQARMTSSRLPGKVLMDVAGRPMLAQQLRRLKQCLMLNEIIVATTTNSTDEPLVALARQEGVGWFRGSEDDVLARFIGASCEAEAEVVVRVTADCPLIDPVITDKVVLEIVKHGDSCDYASNVLERTYPRGLDAEALYMDTLLRINRLATSQAEREHVTVLPRTERKGLFLCRSITDSHNNSDLRWTVDTELDLQLIRALYEELDLSARLVPYHQMLAYVRERPHLANLNTGVETWSPT